MHFTREPIVETIITPKEGCQLVLRNSKAIGQEEYFVDALEVVSFGKSLFFRSLERPKSFLLPVNDYEVVEVRETRMILKHVGVERSIKISSKRDVSTKREMTNKRGGKKETASHAPEAPPEAPPEQQPQRDDKKRDKRRSRRRRVKEEVKSIDSADGVPNVSAPSGITEPKISKGEMPAQASEDALKAPPQRKEVEWGLTEALLAPPPTLISDTIGKYKTQQSEGKESKEVTFSKEIVAEKSPTENAEESPVESPEESKKSKEKRRSAFTSWLFSSSNEEKKQEEQENPKDSQVILKEEEPVKVFDEEKESKDSSSSVEP